MSSHHKPILILGSTGKTGHRVTERLAARGVPIRPVSRSFMPHFDWTDPRSWEPALRGAGKVYLTFSPDVSLPGTADTIGAFAKLAVDCGVTHIVLLSGRGEPEARRCEEAVRSSGAGWTVLRCSWFAQNFSEGFMAGQVRDGTVALPVGDMVEPFVDADDIADVAVAALTEDGHTGRTYELTGPRALTFAAAIGEIAKATGRDDVRLAPISIEEYTAALAAAGLPDTEIGLIRYLFTDILDGRNARPGDGVQRALGRPPRDFTDFARTAAATGIWNP